MSKVLNKSDLKQGYIDLMVTDASNDKLVDVLKEDLVYTVSALSGLIKECIENSFFYVRVQGEVSGYKVASSGHVYFNLKDNDSLLNIVCWRGNTCVFPMDIEDGMEVVCSGSITAYPGRSSYQLILSKLEMAGRGALLALFEKRKQMLTEEGLFDLAHKKKLPLLPKVIALVTSEKGAVLHDMLHRIRDRFPIEVLVYDVAVQGKGAASQIADAIHNLNDLTAGKKIDVVIVARGGGSIEDLWPFNEEVLVRAIYASNIPIVSAVGHQTDVTLCDLVADLRAPTPTAAIEMALPVRDDLIKRIAALISRAFIETEDLLCMNLTNLQKLYISICKNFECFCNINKLKRVSIYQRFSYIAQSLIHKKRSEVQSILHIRHIIAILDQKIQSADKDLVYLNYRLEDALMLYFKKMRAALETIDIAIKRNGTGRLLKRGLALVYDDVGNLLTSCNAVTVGKKLRVEMSDGKFHVVVTERD